VITNKYIPGGRRAFRFFGHPYSHSIPLSQLTDYIDITGQNGAANGFTPTVSNNPSAFWYNTLTGNGSTVNDSTGWIPYTHTNGVGANAWKKTQAMRVLVRGAKGEGLTGNTYIPSAATIKTHGLVNQCDVTFNCQTNANAGFNLVGNPYACNIDLSEITRGSAVGANFAVWDANQGLYGAYVSQPFSFSYILPAHSSFVTTCNSTSNNQIVFSEEDKSPDAASANLFKTTAGFGNDVIQLRILSDNETISWDRLLIFFNGQATSATELLDHQKMGNPGLDFFTYASDGKELSVDMRPYTPGEVIKLGLRAYTEQGYAIRVDDYSVASGTDLYLHDKFLNQSQPLSAGMLYSFNVTSDPNSQGSERFEINGTPTAVEGVGAAAGFNMQMFPNPAGDNVTISFAARQPAAASIRITNLVGQQMYSSTPGTLQQGSVTVATRDFAPGIYMVQLTIGEQTITKRLIKK
jgi:hypothetical protein